MQQYNMQIMDILPGQTLAEKLFLLNELKEALTELCEETDSGNITLPKHIDSKIKDFLNLN